MDKRLSGTHCRIERHLFSGKVVLVDLSTNGTYLNMKEIGKGQKVELSMGDHIHLLIESEAVKKNEEIGYRVELLDMKMKMDKEMAKLKEELKKKDVQMKLVEASKE